MINNGFNKGINNPYIKVNFSKFNSDISNKIFVSCPKFLKTQSPSVFLKDVLKLYVFESLK